MSWLKSLTLHRNITNLLFSGTLIFWKNLLLLRRNFCLWVKHQTRVDLRRVASSIFQTRHWDRNGRNLTDSWFLWLLKLCREYEKNTHINIIDTHGHGWIWRWTGFFHEHVLFLFMELGFWGHWSPFLKPLTWSAVSYIIAWRTLIADKRR